MHEFAGSNRKASLTKFLSCNTKGSQANITYHNTNNISSLQRVINRSLSARKKRMLHNYETVNPPGLMDMVVKEASRNRASMARQLSINVLKVEKLIE